MKWFDRLRDSRHGQSLSLRRAWIEICRSVTSWSRRICRSPYGERGLKLRTNHEYHHRESSLSLRRAWIEIASSSTRRIRYRPSRSPYGERGLKFDGDLTELAGGAGRSPYGERGLKYRNYRNCAGFPCRSPYGERGLKLGVTVYAVVFGVSLFLRRAWIEMSLGSSYLTASLCRSPYGECGLK